jgi:hypothetical protein
MASSGKKKTTMAKLNREAKMRERRMDKAARRDARKQLAADVRDGLVPAPDVDHTLLENAPASSASVATARRERG